MNEPTAEPEGHQGRNTHEAKHSGVVSFVGFVLFGFQPWVRGDSRLE